MFFFFFFFFFFFSIFFIFFYYFLLVLPLIDADFSRHSPVHGLCKRIGGRGVRAATRISDARAQVGGFKLSRIAERHVARGVFAARDSRKRVVRHCEFDRVEFGLY
jgi:hypothetical protein